MPTFVPERLPAIVKLVVFYGAFAVLYLLYVAIVVGDFFWRDASLFVMENIATYTPIIMTDVSVPAQLLPAVLGGVMAWAAPGRAANAQLILLLLLAAIAWIMYLHMQVFFGSEIPNVRDQLLIDNVPEDQIDVTMATLSSFASNVRSFASVVFAAILGLRFNDEQAVLTPPAPGQ